MYNYAVFGDVNEIIRDIVSAFPANEATEFKKMIYNDINFGNMLEANESSIDANTGVGKLLEVMLNTVDANMDTNFAYIGKSRGDITKLKDFHVINASINYINKINTDYGYATNKMNLSKDFNIKNLSRMNEIYDILKGHKTDFEYGYKIDNNIVKNTYSSLVCILIDLTCLNMISVTDFMESIGAHDVPDNNIRPFSVNLGISRNGRYLHNVDKMIKIFHDGSWNKLFKVVRTNNGKKATEDAVTVGVIIALIGAIPMVAIMIVYLIRFFITFYFESAVNIKQKTSALASYINEVSKSEEDPKALYKQTKAVKTLSNISNFIGTKILKEDKSGMERVVVADRELKEKAYISNAGYNQLTNGSSNMNTGEIIFE